MRNFAVCCILLAVAALAPVSDGGSRFDTAWGLGLLVLLAFTGQQVCRSLGLPALVGWIAAGLVLGQGGLKVVRPTAVDSLHLIHLFTAIWVGFQVGLGLIVPAARHKWRLVGTVAISTAAAFAVISAGVAVLVEQPWSLAALMGGLACLWGPVALSCLTDDDESQLISVVGTGVSLLILTVTVVVVHHRGAPSAAALWTAASPWVSLAVGAVLAELLWRLKVFSRRSSAIVGLTGAFLLGAALLNDLSLYGLPLGFACGIVASWRLGSSDILRHLLEPARPLAAMVFFALFGASVDVAGVLWSPSPHPLLYQIVLIQLVVLVLLRGVGPAVWYPLSKDDSGFRRHASWLLLPKGAVLFELVYLPRGGPLSLLSASDIRLIHQFVVVDLLLYGLVFSAVATGITRLFQAYSSPTTETAG